MVIKTEYVMSCSRDLCRRNFFSSAPATFCSRNVLQLFLEDAKVFPGQLGDIIPPVHLRP